MFNSGHDAPFSGHLRPSSAFFTCCGGSWSRAGSWPDLRASSRVGSRSGPLGEGGPLAGAAFIPPAELITEAFKLPSSRGDSQPRGLLASTQVFLPVGSFLPDQSSHHHFPRFLRKQISVSFVEVEMREIIENLHIAETCGVFPQT